MMTAAPIIPDLARAFSLRPERGQPVAVGALATGGERSHVSVVSGSFEGEGLRGRLVGGGETRLRRADGVTVVEASYLIALDDGVSLRAFGSGYLTEDGAFRGLRLPLLFEAAEDGPAAPLATRAFVAEQPAGSAVMTISRII